MQISKAFLALCAAVLLILPPCVRAAETDAQAKARKALEEKLKALESQPATSAAPNAAPAPVVPAAAVTPVTPEPTAPAPPVASSANDDKAREAMRQKLNELQSQSPTVLTNEHI